MSALELEIKAGADLMSFAQDGSPFNTFQPNPFIIGDISIKNDISASLSWEINYERDNVFYNILDFRLVTRTDNFRLEIGPYLGMRDKFETPDAGISGSMEFTLPGIIFLSFSGASTIAARYDFTSNNTRESIEAKFGFWLPFAVTTISAGTKSFTKNYDDFFDPVRDSLTRFQLSIDFFGKNSPVTARIDGGYQILSRTYLGFFGTFDELNAFFGGFEINWRVSRPLRLILGAELPFGITSNMPQSQDEFWRFFKAYAGVAVTFF